MDIQTATTAVPLVSQIETLQTLVDNIDTALSEHWEISQLKVSAPATGSTSQEGTLLDLIPFGGFASDTNSQIALTQARLTYQTALDAVKAQLTNL